MSEKSSSPVSSSSPLPSATHSDEKTTNVPPIEAPVLCEFPDDSEDYYPEGGRGWIVVAGCFLQAAVSLGSPLAWGVFQQYYKEHLFPDASETTLSLLGATNGAVMPLTSFIFGKLEDRYGYKWFVVLGSVISFLGWFGAAWSTQLWHFFLTQGVLMGLANGILFPTICAYPSQWFLKRRAFATGICIAGSSLGGGTTAVIIRAMLSNLSLRKTLLIFSAINFTCLFVAFLMVSERPGHSRADRREKAKRLSQNGELDEIHWVDTALFKQSIFWSVVAGLGVTVFGYQTPYFFISVFTTDKIPTISPFLSTVPILVMNYSAASGRILVGLFADKFLGPVNTFMLSILVSGLTQVLIWNFASNLGAIFAFAILYGFWGGVVISLLPPAAGQIFGHEQLANLSGLLILSNLPGYISGPTLGGVVLGASGRNWHVVSLYSGGMQLLGVCLLIYARLKSNKRIFVRY